MICDQIAESYWVVYNLVIVVLQCELMILLANEYSHRLKTPPRIRPRGVNFLRKMVQIFIVLDLLYAANIVKYLKALLT